MLSIRKKADLADLEAFNFCIFFVIFFIATSAETLKILRKPKIELKEILREPKIRLVVTPTQGYGDQVATLRIVNWLRAAGFGGWIELVVYEKAISKVAQLLNLPYNLPTATVHEKKKIMIIAFKDFLSHLKNGEIDLIHYGITGSRPVYRSYINYAEMFGTNVFLVITPYRFYDSGGIDYDYDPRQFDSNQIYTAGIPKLFFQPDSVKYVVWEDIWELNKLLEFLKSRPKGIDNWVTDFINLILNDKINVMPIYGLLKNSEDFFPFTIAQIICGIKAAQNIDNLKLNTKPIILFLPQAISIHMLQELQKLLTYLRDNELTEYSIPVIHIITREKLLEDGIESITNAEPGEILLLIVGRLPKIVFDAIYTCPRTNILPPTSEGANSGNILAQTGRPYLHCSKYRDFWDGEDLKKASQLVQRLLLKVDEKLCQIDNLFELIEDSLCSSSYQENPMGKIIVDSFNPESEVTNFFKALQKQVTEDDKVNIGLKGICAATKKAQKKLNLLPELAKGIQRGKMNIVRKYLKLNSPIPTMIVDGNVFHTTPAFCVTHGHFAILNTLIRHGLSTELPIEEIPDNLKFFSCDHHDFVKKINEYYSELIQYQDIKSIKQARPSIEKLNLLLKFAIAFDMKEKIELIMRLNPDLTIVHKHYSVLSIALAAKNLELVSQFLKNKVPIATTDLELAAKYTDISTFKLILERINLKECNMVKVSLNTIRSNNIAIFEFLSLQYPEDIKRVLSIALRGGHFRQISFEMSNKIVDIFVAHKSTCHDYSLLLRAWYSTHTPDQLQILFEKITEHCDQVESLVSGSLNSLLLYPRHLKYLLGKVSESLNATIKAAIFNKVVTGGVLYKNIEQIYGSGVFGNDLYLEDTTISNGNISKLELPFFLMPLQNNKFLKLRCWVQYLGTYQREIFNISPKNLCKTKLFQPFSYCRLTSSALTKYKSYGFTNNNGMKIIVYFSDLFSECEIIDELFHCFVKFSQHDFFLEITPFGKLPSSDEHDEYANCSLVNPNEIFCSGNNSFMRMMYAYNSRELFFIAFKPGLIDGLLFGVLYKITDKFLELGATRGLKIELSELKREIVRDISRTISILINMQLSSLKSSCRLTPKWWFISSLLINTYDSLLKSCSCLSPKWTIISFFPKYSKAIREIFSLIYFFSISINYHNSYSRAVIY